MVAIWLAHATNFAGHLLRRWWSRLFAALLSFGWTALLGVQITDHLARGSPIDLGELAIALALISAGVLLVLHLAMSQRIKVFLSPK